MLTFWWMLGYPIYDPFLGEVLSGGGVIFIDFLLGWPVALAFLVGRVTAKRV
jgi:hypothetical protein